MGWLDMIFGKDRQREAEAEKARQEQEAAVERFLAKDVREVAQQQPEPIQRSEKEARPGERFMPHHAERQQEMHDHPREAQKPDREREATRMEYTRTAQAALSMGSPGVVFINPRAQQRNAYSAELENTRTEIAAEQEKQREPRRSIWENDLQEAERQVAAQREKGLENEKTRDHTNERGGRQR